MTTSNGFMPRNDAVQMGVKADRVGVSDVLDEIERELNLFGEVLDAHEKALAHALVEHQADPSSYADSILPDTKDVSELTRRAMGVERTIRNLRDRLRGLTKSVNL